MIKNHVLKKLEKEEEKRREKRKTNLGTVV
jgi:hypothetical protein